MPELFDGFEPVDVNAAILDCKSLIANEAAQRQVRIVTELAVIEVTPRGLELKEIASDTTIDAVRAATGAELIVEGTPVTF